MNTIEGWTSSRIDDACMAAASANICSMNCGGALSWSIEWAPIGLVAALAAATPGPASATAQVRNVQMTSTLVA